MERAGLRLKHVREKLGLTYRDVEKASQGVAERHGNEEFAIALSRLADIENKGTLPTIYRLYSLCAIYRLDFHETLRWYGIPIDMVASEALRIPLDKTHALHFNATNLVPIPQLLEKEIDLSQTIFLSPVIRRWGKGGLNFLHGWDPQKQRFGLIGLKDWSMHPVLHPGSLVLIDESRRRIAAEGWTDELDRPIYFLQHRGGYRCAWCAVDSGSVVVQPHPSSYAKPEVFAAGEIDVIGQVTGVAMLFESRRRRPVPNAAAPARFPNL